MPATAAFTDLQDTPRWLAWREEKVDDRIAKMPYDVHGYGRGSATNPATWGTHSEAEIRAQRLYSGERRSGCGIVLGQIDEHHFLAGVDLDSSIDENGVLAPWATRIVDALNSYSEISPSGWGLKIFFYIDTGDVRWFLDRAGAAPERWGFKRGVLGRPGVKHGPGIEIYCSHHYFTVTGQLWPPAPPRINRVDRSQLEKLAVVASTAGTADDTPADPDDPADPFAMPPGKDGLNQEPDTSRSGKAYGAVMAWRGELTGSATFEDMLEMLRAHDDPDILSWVAQYSQEPGERQLRRLWENTGGDGTAAPGGAAPGTASSGVGAAGTRKRELEFIHAVDMRPQLDSSVLVKDVISPEQISLLVGAPGEGKTFLAIDRDLHIAAGLKWFGHIVRPGPVVYLAIEAGRRIIQNRVYAWLQEHDMVQLELPFTAITSPVDLCHLKRRDVDLLIATIREKIGYETPALVEIDTVSRALAGGDENSPVDMGAFVFALDRIRAELHCHVSAVHHLGKDKSKGSRGHTILPAAADTWQEVAKLVGAGDTGISSYTITRQRDGMAGGRLYFKLPQFQLGVDEDGDPVTTCTVKPVDDPGVAQGGSGAKLTDKDKIALSALRKALEAAGTIPPAAPDIPPNKVCVTIEVWRRYAYVGGISDTQDGARMAFKRSLDRLTANGHVGRYLELVWLL